MNVFALLCLFALVAVANAFMVPKMPRLSQRASMAVITEGVEFETVCLFPLYKVDCYLYPSVSSSYHMSASYDFRSPENGDWSGVLITTRRACSPSNRHWPFLSLRLARLMVFRAFKEWSVAAASTTRSSLLCQLRSLRPGYVASDNNLFWLLVVFS